MYITLGFNRNMIPVWYKFPDYPATSDFPAYLATSDLPAYPATSKLPDYPATSKLPDRPACSSDYLPTGNFPKYPANRIFPHHPATRSFPDLPAILRLRKAFQTDRSALHEIRAPTDRPRPRRHHRSGSCHGRRSRSLQQLRLSPGLLWPRRVSCSPTAYVTVGQCLALHYVCTIKSDNIIVWWNFTWPCIESNTMFYCCLWVIN